MKNIVHNSDCLPAMREMKDNQYSLAIVDPPYGQNNALKTKGRISTKSKHRNFNWGYDEDTRYKFSDWDKNKPPKEYFNELFRISENQIVWGYNYFADVLGNTKGFVFWDKKPNTDRYSDGELAYTSFDKVAKRFTQHWIGIIRHGQEKGYKAIHPTQKPIKLYKWLLKNYAKEGDTILDTHVGSGSHRIACWEMGFPFEGWEIDKDYWLAQEKRFAVVKNQMRLF